MQGNETRSVEDTGLYLAFNYEKRLLHLAQQAAAEENFEECLWLLERCIKLFPGSSNASALLGEVLGKLERWDECIRAYRSALYIDPGNRTYLYAVLRILNECECFSDVEDTVLSGDPNLASDSITQVLRSVALLAQGQLEKVYTILKIDAELAKHSTVYLEELGNLAACAIYRGFTQLAREIIGFLVDLPELRYAATPLPQIAAVLVQLTLVEQGPNAALKALELLLPVSKDCASLNLEAARRFNKYGHAAEAEELLKKGFKSFGGTQYLKELLRAQVGRRADSKQEKCVVFVECDPRARAMRIAGALRQAGWRTVLIHRGDLFFEATSFFDESMKCATHEEAIYAAWQFNPRIYHLFSGHADPFTAAFFREKKSLGTLVFDPWDMVEGMIKQFYSYEVGQLQRYCIESSDGVTCRDFRMKHLRDVIGHQFPKKVVFFRDYISELHGLSRAITERYTDDIHVAMVGSFATSRDKHELNWHVPRMAQSFARDRVHFHVYPNQNLAYAADSESKFAELIALTRELPYFHLHSPVQMDRLFEELQKFHFGINGPWDRAFYRSSPFYTNPYHSLCLSARNMDYVEAGVPVITPKAMRSQFHSVNRFGVGVGATPEFWNNPRRFLEELLNNPDLRVNMGRAQAEYHINRHVSRLIRFYEQF